MEERLVRELEEKGRFRDFIFLLEVSFRWGTKFHLLCSCVNILKVDWGYTVFLGEYKIFIVVCDYLRIEGVIFFNHNMVYDMVLNVYVYINSSSL